MMAALPPNWIITMISKRFRSITNVAGELHCSPGVLERLCEQNKIYIHYHYSQRYLYKVDVPRIKEFLDAIRHASRINRPTPIRPETQTSQGFQEIVERYRQSAVEGINA